VGEQAPAIGVGRAHRQAGAAQGRAAAAAERRPRRVHDRPRAAGAGPAVPARRRLRFLQLLRQGQAAAAPPRHRQAPAPLTNEFRARPAGRAGVQALSLVMHAVLLLATMY